MNPRRRRKLIDLSPVRQYSQPNVLAQRAFYREAATRNPGLEKYVNKLMDRVLRVNGAEALKAASLNDLEDMIDSEQDLMVGDAAWPEGIMAFVAENPFILTLPLKSISKDVRPRTPLYQFLVYVVQSIGKNVLVDSIKGLSVEELKKREQQKAAAVPEDPWLGPAGYADQILSPVEFGAKPLPLPELSPYTFQYLEAALEAWAEQTNIDKSAFPQFVKDNPPKSGALGKEAVVKILAKSHRLPDVVVDPFLQHLSPNHNVLMLVNAIIDSAIAENALDWWKRVGKDIDWSEKVVGLGGREDAPTKPGRKVSPPAKEPTTTEMPTKVEVPTEVMEQPSRGQKPAPKKAPPKKRQPGEWVEETSPWLY